MRDLPEPGSGSRSQNTKHQNCKINVDSLKSVNYMKMKDIEII